MRKFLWYSIIIIFIVVIGYFIKNKIHQNLDYGVNIDNQKWSQKYPQVFNNSGYNNLIESNGILNKLKNNPKSLQKLQGKITNEFGIRDDILEYILSLNLNNEFVNIAAIKYAQGINLIYYSDLNFNEKQKIDNNLSLILTCLTLFTKNYNIYDRINQYYSDNGVRKSYIENFDNHYFAYKVIGSGLSFVDEKEKCKKGDY